MPVAISVSRNEILGINCLSLTFYQFFRVGLNYRRVCIHPKRRYWDKYFWAPGNSWSLIGYSHHIPWFAIHFCASICLMLIQHPSQWISFLCSIIYFLTKLVVWSHKTCRRKDKEFIWGLLPIFYLLIHQRLFYGAFIPPHIHIVESDLFCSWLQATTFTGSVKLVQNAWRASGTKWIRSPV